MQRKVQNICADIRGHLQVQDLSTRRRVWLQHVDKHIVPAGSCIGSCIRMYLHMRIYAGAPAGCFELFAARYCSMACTAIQEIDNYIYNTE